MGGIATFPIIYVKACASPAEQVERLTISQRVIYDGGEDCVEVQDKNPLLVGGDTLAGVWTEPNEASSASELD